MRLSVLNNFFTKRFSKAGFTLAELLVVLAVLAVIGAILLPTVFHSMPDENKLRFKKGYYTLKRTIDAMVNSDAYSSTDGNFGVILGAAGDKPPYAAELGAADTGAKYFCIQFSEMLNSTNTQCDTFLNNTGLVTNTFSASDITGDSSSGNTLDGKCAGFMANDASKQYVNVATQDGIYWSVPLDNFSGIEGSNQAKYLTGYGKVPVYYGVICMDVDGVGGESAFGFGIRRDGKVIAGKKAKEWLQEGTSTAVSTDEDE